MNATSLSDLRPGDHFIEKLIIDSKPLYTYGFFERIDPATGFFLGECHYDDPTIQLSGKVLSGAQHEFVAVISKRAYRYAQRLAWPNEREKVEEIIRYSNEKTRIQRVSEALRRMFERRDETT